MKRNGEDQLRLDINEAPDGGGSSSGDANPNYEDLCESIGRTVEGVETYAEQAGMTFIDALRKLGVKEERINEVLEVAIPESNPVSLPEVDMSNVKTSYSRVNVELGKVAGNLVAAAEAAAMVRPGRISKAQKRHQDTVERELYKASGLQIMVDDGIIDQSEATFRGQRGAGGFIGKFGGTDNQESRDKFIKVQKNRAE
ncbi:MAG: hypothetical protein NTV39_00650 [Candidatus Saccharibacteria bacterium]|nr:hypothetical protein [Candidatus Saccharibacteria bacterium]